MKKTIVKNASLSLVCLLGVGGLVGLSKYSRNIAQVRAIGEIDLSTLDSDYTAHDGETLTGTMTEHHKISIEDGATVTLQDVNINLYSYSDNDHEYAGIELLGDGKLILSGNNVVSTHHSNYAAIFVPNNKTITIDAVDDTASLELNATDSPYEHAYGSCGAGIGANATTPCGNIIIEKGIINAYTCHGAGIGAGGFYGGDCGSITINGGTITSYGDAGGGIGGTDTASVGNITINGGNVTAISNHYSAGIGGGKGNNCGDILITGGIVTATGNGAFPGIGGGASCGNITIMDTVALVTATKGQTSMYSVGPSVMTDDTCGTITIGGEVTEPITTNPFVYPIHHTHDWSYTASGASITAECASADCPVTSGLTLTLVAPTNLVYDGTAKTASFQTGYDASAFKDATIVYKKDGVSVSQCIDAGTYEASVTVGGATAKLQFEITQATPTGYDVPTGLVATYGNTLSSVTLPEHWSWKNPTDKVGNAGERTHVAIYTPTNPNYHSVEENVTIDVAKANPTYEAPTIDAPYNVDLSTVGLPEGFSWMDGSQKTSTWGENTFKAKYTPSDTVNYNIVDNIDIKVNVKWILVDPTEGDVSVTISGSDSEFTVDISVKVEVNTEVTVEQKRSEYSDIGRRYIKPDEDISEIYSVKLIKKVGTTETEIQPSDIKEGTKIIVSMPVPTELVGQQFRLLEIFNSSEAKEFSNTEYAITGDGKTLMVEIDRMGEFAFIIHTDSDNGFVYTTPGGGIPAVAVVFIVLGAILLVLVGAWALMMFVFNKWIRREDKAIRVFKLFGIKKDDKFLVVSFPVKFEYKLDNEIFNTKEEALKE